MFLRFFLKVVKPTNEQLRKSKDSGWLSQTTLKVYQWFLSILQKTYLHYAISDTVVLENGRIKIIHESRDIEFENELKRNGIDIRLHMLTTSMPFNTYKKRKGLWYKYFEFSDLISIYVDDKELFIKHDASFSISGTMRARLKTSSPSDILYGSVMEVLPLLYPKNYDQTIVVPQKRHQQEPIQPSSDKDRKNDKAKQTRRVNIFGNDILPTPKVTSGNNIEEDKTKEPVSIEKKGFKIDTSF